MRRRAAACALPWLITCMHAESWADPMRPLIPPAAVAAPVASAPERAARPREPDAAHEPERLVAIRQDGESRWQALFGERWVGVGDRLERYTVVAVEANTVQLAEGRQRRTLHLLPPLLRPGPTPAASDSRLSSRPRDVMQAQAPVPSIHPVPGAPSP